MCGVVLLPGTLAAQESPFLPAPVYGALDNEMSGDIAYEHIRWFTHYHRPMGGSEGFEAVAKYVETKAREYGLEDVRYIPLRYSSNSWTAQLGELWLIAPTERRLAFSPEVAVSLADYSRPTDLAAVELVDVGAGTSDSDYAGKEVSGRVVLSHGAPAEVMKQAVWARGALGIITFTMARRELIDQVPWQRIPVENDDKTEQGTFGFVLSQREGLRLRAELATAKTSYRVRAKVVSTFREPPSQAIVEAVIRGSSIHDQAIVLTGHLQEGPFSANDDASGCASVLEIARALKRLIDTGRLPRPARDIRFWWANEISAEEQYFADHPEERTRILVNINQDMVGARQSAGSRVQFVTRPPASRASFLGDIVESIVESLVQGNTAFLAAGQARQTRQGLAATSGGSVATEEEKFTRPIFSRLGTREGYDARVIPFHNNTDHQVFNMAPIGIPGVTFTNWPDDYIHSTDDDLWQIDPTQLKRNAIAVAGSAWFIATAGAAELRVLSAQAVTRALERIGHDTRRASEIIIAAVNDPSIVERADGVVRESVAREQRALRTMAVLSREAGPGVVTAALTQLPSADDVAARLSALTAISGSSKMTAPVPSSASDARVPVFVDDVAGFLERRKAVKRPTTLHPLMAYEALNFVDGTRTVADIFRAVAAEADLAGDWYYGQVTREDISRYLDSAASAGILTMKPPISAGKRAGSDRKGR
jgi:Zn-dependent M28 family amino/carboxypeptidase